MHYGKILNHKIKEIDYTMNPYGYTGRETDKSDLYYYRARYYDPSIQRFLSLDPIEFKSGDFNFYRYVGNDPVNFRDPSGMNPFLLGMLVAEIPTVGFLADMRIMFKYKTKELRIYEETMDLCYEHGKMDTYEVYAKKHTELKQNMLREVFQAVVE